jgi:hypothetical protein
MKNNDIKKVVLAYSGGLDTSVIIPWLKENYETARSSQFPPTSARPTSWRDLRKRPSKPALPRFTSKT